MAKRPVFHPDLAGFFAGLRESAGWGQREAADIARRKGLAITRQVLLRLEKGKTKWPDPAVLKDLAVLYDRPYQELVRIVASHAYSLESLIQEPERSLEVPTEEGVKSFVGVPLMDGKIAAGSPLAIHDFEVLDYLPFTSLLLDQLGVSPESARCVRVGPREMSMFSTIKPGEVVLLDCSDGQRDHPTPGRIYAVNLDGGSTLKRIDIANDGLRLHSDNLDKATYPMMSIPFDDDTRMRNHIAGRAVWSGGELL